MRSSEVAHFAKFFFSFFTVNQQGTCELKMTSPGARDKKFQKNSPLPATPPTIKNNDGNKLI
ncbi:CLUMA_CG018648, isoform A [Clunio marinus]|uniref:CLUMA_CG018648, isoform A n=1 Tax=Clunio marinus TaxID=568069 RepID=A0A1J1IY59_9DIPT|nr:CLUMA_CG018648, isoform A [Clunio marinus]